MMGTSESPFSAASVFGIAIPAALTNRGRPASSNSAPLTAVSPPYDHLHDHHRGVPSWGTIVNYRREVP